LQSITTEARSSMMAVRTLLVEKVFEARDAGKREVVFLSQLRSQRHFLGGRSHGRWRVSLPPQARRQRWSK